MPLTPQARLALLVLRAARSSEISTTVFITSNDGKVKVQAWKGPEGSRRFRLPDFKTIGI